MFSTDFIFRQQENLVDNKKCQARFRPLCNKILFKDVTLLILKFGFSEKATNFEENLCRTFDMSVVFCVRNSVLVKKLRKIFQNNAVKSHYTNFTLKQPLNWTTTDFRTGPKTVPQPTTKPAKICLKIILTIDPKIIPRICQQNALKNDPKISHCFT